jgi:hypothetical protein
MKRYVVAVSIILVGLFSLATGDVMVTPRPEPMNVGIWFLRTDSQGDTLWTRIYCEEDQYPYWPTFARQTSDGGYIITGGFFDDRIHDFYGKKFWLIKISKTGWMKWCEIYNIPPYENAPLLSAIMPSYVTETSDKGYLIECSWVSFVDEPRPPLWFVQVDHLGKIVSYNDSSTLTASLTKGDPFLAKYNPLAKTDYPYWPSHVETLYRKTRMCILETGAIVEVRDTVFEKKVNQKERSAVALIKGNVGVNLTWCTIWTRVYSVNDYVHAHFVGLTSDNGVIALARISFPSD